jgi:hypothetical protein
MFTIFLRSISFAFFFARLLSPLPHPNWNRSENNGITLGKKIGALSKLPGFERFYKDVFDADEGMFRDFSWGNSTKKGRQKTHTQLMMFY